MSLNRTPVYRNLRTRVTFMYLEFEDLIVVLFIAPVAFFIGGLFDRDLLDVPMKLLLQWGAPAVTIVLLLTFKYGKPRGHLRDWWTHQTKPRIYCGIERDSGLNCSYLNEGD